MKTIVNKTTDPLRVPLPQGKTLHLGPKKTGQISVHDVEHPPLVKMVEVGKVEIQDHAGNEAIPSVSQEGAAHVHAWGDKSKAVSFPTKTADGG
jgi:hypothetical protein